MPDEVVATNVVVTQPTNVEGAIEPTVDISAVDDVVAKATHQRVLQESKKYRTELLALKGRWESLEDEALKEQGREKERADKLSERLTRVEAEKSALLIESKLVPALVAAGCIDTATALKLIDKSLIQEDGGDLVGKDDAVAALQKANPYMFGSKVPSSINSAVPAGGIKQPNQKLDTSKMSSDDMLAELRRLEALGA